MFDFHNNTISINLNKLGKVTFWVRVNVKGNINTLFVRLNIVFAPVFYSAKRGVQRETNRNEVLKRGVEHEGGTPLSYPGTRYCSM